MTNKIKILHNANLDLRRTKSMILRYNLNYALTQINHLEILGSSI